MRIVVEENCKAAAKKLGLKYKQSWSGPTSTPGCIFANDGRSEVYFNTVLEAKGTNPKYAEICTTGRRFIVFSFYRALWYTLYKKIWSK